MTSILIGSDAGARRRLSRSGGFWTSAVIFGLFLFTSTVPSPMYGLYQVQWGFTATTLTVVFAVYAGALLLTLLFLGRLSDHLGRRPLIAAALAVTLAALLLFLFANDVSWLFAARILQGIGAGIATTTISATLIDLQREGSGHGPLISTFVPGFAMAVGALTAAALVEYGPDPTHLVWIVLLALFVAAGLALAVFPEPVERHPGAVQALRPKISVAKRHVGIFAAAVPGLIAVWALGAFYLSLGPSLVSSLTGSGSLLLGGLVIFLLTGLGALASLLFRNAAASIIERFGMVALLLGTVLTLIAVAASTTALFFVGTSVAGIGWGVAYLGLFRSLAALAGPTERAGMVSAIYIVAYLAMSVPAVFAGLVTTAWGLRPTAIAYTAVIAVLATITTVEAFTGRRHRSAPARLCHVRRGDRTGSRGWRKGPRGALPPVSATRIARTRRPAVAGRSRSVRSRCGRASPRPFPSC